MLPPAPPPDDEPPQDEAPQDATGRFGAGWWIIPLVLLGALGWVLILMWIF